MTRVFILNSPVRSIRNLTSAECANLRAEGARTCKRTGKWTGGSPRGEAVFAVFGCPFQSDGNGQRAYQFQTNLSLGSSGKVSR